MKKLKVLFYGNIFSTSGGTKSFALLKDSELVDLYFGAPGDGALSQYDISNDKIIILPDSNNLGNIFNNDVSLLTKDMDIVIDVCAGIPIEHPYKSILYHTNAPIKIMHTAFNPDILVKSKDLNIDAYFSCSLDVLREYEPIENFNKEMFCLYCIQPPIENNIEEKNKIREKYNIPADAFLIGSTCADDTLNRYVATNFLKKYPNVYFLTTCSYGESDRFGSTGIPNNFRPIGKIPPKDINSLLSSFDVFLHTRTETFGSCVYEAMEAGIPVVARWTSSNNGYAECIYPHGGFLCGPGDNDVFLSAKCCIDALEYVYNNYDKALERANIAKNRVIRWHPKNIIPQFERLFASLAVKKGILNISDCEKYLKIDIIPNTNDLIDWKDIKRKQIQENLLKKSFI